MFKIGIASIALLISGAAYAGEPYPGNTWGPIGGVVDTRGAMGPYATDKTTAPPYAGDPRQSSGPIGGIVDTRGAMGPYATDKTIGPRYEGRYRGVRTPSEYGGENVLPVTY